MTMILIQVTRPPHLTFDFIWEENEMIRREKANASFRRLSPEKPGFYIQDFFGDTIYFEFEGNRLVSVEKTNAGNPVYAISQLEFSFLKKQKTIAFKALLSCREERYLVPSRMFTMIGSISKFDFDLFIQYLGEITLKVSRYTPLKIFG